MSDNDLVQQCIAELQDIVRCRCHPACRDRGMQDPDCECDSGHAVQVVADRIEELEAKLAQQDDLVQAAVAAALREAAERMRHAAATEDEFGRTINAAIFDTAVKLILALITDDAQAALDRAIAAAIRKGGE